MDFEDLRAHDRPTRSQPGATYVRDRITPENLDAAARRSTSATGDLLIDLAWNIDTRRRSSQWCHDHGVLYINTSVEVWDPYADADDHAADRAHALRPAHEAARAGRRRGTTDGPTAVVEHGANPGLVSHWTKVALEDIADAMLAAADAGRPRARAGRLEAALGAPATTPRLAMPTGTKVIHISERDTQISDRPKEVDEFVNTWSVEGFYEEGIAPAELGWGTHEPALPAARVHPRRRPAQPDLPRADRA